MKYIGNEEGIDIQTAKEFSEQGIDVFNPKDSFFNDICHSFKNKADIILKDRRDDIFQNITFCQDGCIYNGINYDLMAANCICDISILKGISSENDENNNNKNIVNNKASSFTSNLLDFNYNVILCYNLVFNLDILKNNFGFFSLFILLCIQLILFFIFMIKRLKPIKYFMHLFKPFEPNANQLYSPLKSNKKSKKNYNIIKEGNISKNIELSKKTKKPNNNKIRKEKNYDNKNKEIINNKNNQEKTKYEKEEETRKKI